MAKDGSGEPPSLGRNGSAISMARSEAMTRTPRRMKTAFPTSHHRQGTGKLTLLEIMALEDLERGQVSR